MSGAGALATGAHLLQLLAPSRKGLARGELFRAAQCTKQRVMVVSLRKLSGRMSAAHADAGVGATPQQLAGTALVLIGVVVISLRPASGPKAGSP